MDTDPRVLAKVCTVRFMCLPLLHRVSFLMQLAKFKSRRRAAADALQTISPNQNCENSIAITAGTASTLLSTIAGACKTKTPRSGRRRANHDSSARASTADSAMQLIASIAQNIAEEQAKLERQYEAIVALADGPTKSASPLDRIAGGCGVKQNKISVVYSELLKPESA